jgi:tetratricopeptide (TPR) repeat protein
MESTIKRGYLGVLAALLLVNAPAFGEPSATGKDAIPARYTTLWAQLYPSEANVRLAVQKELRAMGDDPEVPKAIRHQVWMRVAAWGEPGVEAAFRKALELTDDPIETASAQVKFSEWLLPWKQDPVPVRALLDPLIQKLDSLPKNIQGDLLSAMARTLIAQKDFAGAAKWTRVYLDKGFADTERQMIASTLTLAQCLAKSGKPDDAVALMQTQLDQVATVQNAADAQNIILWMIQWRLDEKNPKAAVETLRKALTACERRPIIELLPLRLKLSEVLQTELKDNEAAEKESRWVFESVAKMTTEELAAAAGAQAQAEKAVRMMRTQYQASGRKDKLMALVEEVLASSCMPAGAVALAAEMAVATGASDTGKVDRVATSFHVCAARRSAEPDILGACQQAVVKLQMTTPGRQTEAIQEARIFYRTCPTAKLGEAAELIATVLKAADFNLGRANAFLRFQKYGAAGEDGQSGTADDLTDPLTAVSSIAPAAERNKPYAAALAELPSDWMGLRARAKLLVCMDRSAEAFDALQQSFSLCPAKDADLKAVTEDLTALVVRHTRNLALAQRLTDYVMNGPAGADGKAGTKDDPGDAFADARAQLTGKNAK